MVTKSTESEVRLPGFKFWLCYLLDKYFNISII